MAYTQAPSGGKLTAKLTFYGHTEPPMDPPPPAKQAFQCGHSPTNLRGLDGWISEGDDADLMEDLFAAEDCASLLISVKQFSEQESEAALRRWATPPRSYKCDEFLTELNKCVYQLVPHSFTHLSLRRVALRLNLRLLGAAGGRGGSGLSWLS